MKKIFIVANWKANMSIREASYWIERIDSSALLSLSVKEAKQDKDKEVIVCPPFTLLTQLHEGISQKKLPIKLGAQDVSPFPKGAYTGEIAAQQLAEFAEYVIVGHSERRRYFHEDDQMLANKVDMLKESDITPIYCVQNPLDIIPNKVNLVAYEPVFAIGSGYPDTPENANNIARQIKESYKVEIVLYGGSVTSKNVNSFTRMAYIDGVLV
jgi:triosephosphate isomerase